MQGSWLIIDSFKKGPGIARALLKFSLRSPPRVIIAR